MTFTDFTTNTTLGTAAAGASTTRFTGKPPFFFSVYANDIALGDLNGDGTEDMVLVSYYGGIMVALGNGDGTFAAPTFVPSVSNITGVAVTLADLNGDGKTDMVVAANIGVAVFLGNGNGTFSVEHDYPLTAAQSVAVADFNGDGRLDIATANNYPSGSMGILLGKGDGTFQTAHAYPADSGSQSVTVGDYNGDGKIDAAVSNTTGTVSLFLGKGDGTFAPQTLLTGSSTPNSSGPRGIASGDINGDGKQDLVLANFGSEAVGILFGKGNGTFQEVQQFPLPTGATPSGVIVADINGDGEPDVAVSTTNSFEAVVLLNNGDQTFRTTGYVSASNPSSISAYSLAVGDLNGDGVQDIALVGGEAYDVLLGQTAFTTSLAHVSLPGSGSDTVIAKYSGDAHFAGSTSNALTLTSMSRVAATPTFSLPAGTYPKAQTIKLADATPGATIYYTTNGTAPATASAKYTAAITVSATEKVEAIAVAPGYVNSAIAHATFTIATPAATPTITLASGTYAMPISTTITDYAGTNLSYCTSTSGNCTPATTYTSVVTIDASPTEYFCAYGTATGYAQSATVCHVYKNAATATAATPTFSLPAVTYATAQSIALADATAGATIYYTTNGTAPTTASPVYTGAITVSATEKVEATAVAPGYTTSAIAHATFTIN